MVELPEEWEVAPEPGWVAAELAEELPGLGLLCTTIDGGSGRSPSALKHRLLELSDRFGGAQAVMLRQRPIPWAYRVFQRQIGLDPDQTPSPVEQLTLERMREGRFKSRGRLEDSITIATVEVGVAGSPPCPRGPS
jgi:DNA/RNA-binding domain of Phe-tRNA-synthetase-like protein